jgi:glycosyltransferase involved in cell wall biosynthesis
MNILMLTAYPPVLHTHGGGVRMFHNIRLLAEKHNVRVISFVENDEERDLLKTVEPVCESIAGIQRVPDFSPHWFSLKPFLVWEFATPEMYAAVDKVFREWKVDVLQCDYLQMAQYRRPGVFSIFTAHEAVSPNLFHRFRHAGAPIDRLRFFHRWMATLNYEASVCNRFNRVVTMTKEDAEFLRSYAHRANIRHIPIGVDPIYFKPSPDEPRRPPEVLFIGNFRHDPNVEAAQFILRELAPRFPDLRFVIAGSYLPDGLPRSANVDFSGYVADTRRLFHGPDTIFAAPLFSGRGQRVKLLEAFAMGCPVITTSIGAFGFPVRDRLEAFIADNADDFREALTSLLSSAELRVQTGAQARRMIEDRFTWTRIGEEFNRLVEEHRQI